MEVDDIFNIREVRDPQRSPDGKWVAYTVTTRRQGHRQERHRRLDGQLGRDAADPADLDARKESSPRWSPDGKFLVLHLVPTGGEGRRRSGCSTAPAAKRSRSPTSKVVSPTTPGRPTARRLVLVVADPDPAVQPTRTTDEPPRTRSKTPKPIVVDRYSFKADGDGFLRGERQPPLPVRHRREEGRDPHAGRVRRRVAGVVARRQADRVRPAPWREATSTRCRTRISSSSTRGPERAPRRLTTTTAEESGRLGVEPGRDGSPISSATSSKYSAYDQAADRRDSVAAAGKPRTLTRRARPAGEPACVVGGRAQPAVHDRGRPCAAHWRGCRPSGGHVERLIGRPAASSTARRAPIRRRFAVLASTATTLPEVYALENGKLRKLTAQNDDWMKGVLLGTTEDFTSTARTGRRQQPPGQAGDVYGRPASIRRCCASMADRTARTSTRSTSSASSSRPTASS